MSTDTQKMQALARNTLSFTEHKRKESQFEAVKFQLSNFMTEEEAQKLSWEAVNEYHENLEESNKNLDIIEKKQETEPKQTKKETINNIIDSVMSKHSRKRSQFNALNEELSRVFDEKEVRRIAKKVMKRIFAKQAFVDADKINKEKELKLLEKQQLEYYKNELNTIKNKLVYANNTINDLKEELFDLSESKQKLSFNVNNQMNIMRDYLKIYQNIIKEKSCLNVV